MLCGRLPALDRIFPLFAVAGILRGTHQRIERMATMDGVRDVGIETKHEDAQEEQGRLNRHIPRKEIAPHMIAYRPPAAAAKQRYTRPVNLVLTHRTADADMTQKTRAEGRRNHRNSAATKQPRNEIMRPSTRYDASSKTVTGFNETRAASRIPERRRRPKSDGGCHDGGEYRSEGNPGGGLGHLDVARQGVEPQSDIPGALRVVPHPVLEVGNEPAHGSESGSQPCAI